MKVVLFLLLGLVRLVVSQEAPTCSWFDQDCYVDPNLVEMPVDLGQGIEDTFLAYVTPDVSSFYNETDGARTPAKPKFAGQFGKFINMSPYTIQVFWDSGKNRKDVYIAEILPFEAAGTATFPTHRFIVKDKADLSKHLIVWDVVKETSLYVYDPFQSGDLSLRILSPSQRAKYDLQKNNLVFAKQYQQVAGREWLSLYPHRPRPTFPMWPADYFGQEHFLSTTETHFVEHPPEHIMGRVKKGEPARRLEEYRTGHDTLNMTLKVLSCSPRVFEIQNFLSTVEIDHVLELATGMKLHLSTTKAGQGGNYRSDTDTRTSRNTWVQRERSPIMDAIYRRSAELMKMDEAYLRQRMPNERPDIPHMGSNAEQLQLVHYDVGQQYTPHHDFMVPTAGEGQPMRFATILFYLNEDMVGGETSFPRWLNSETGEQLKVKPEVGKAILFYNLLPDGNMDERSQHAALPVKKGEKWLINLWTWDPSMHFR